MGLRSVFVPRLTQEELGPVEPLGAGVIGGWCWKLRDSQEIAPAVAMVRMCFAGTKTALRRLQGKKNPDLRMPPRLAGSGNRSVAGACKLKKLEGMVSPLIVRQRMAHRIRRRGAQAEARFCRGLVRR